MDFEEIEQFLPTVLDKFFPGTRQNLLPGAPLWVVEENGSVALIGALRDPVQVRVTAGIALHVPDSPHVFRMLSDVNRGLNVGRAYAVQAEPGWHLVLQESVWGSALSMDHPPSIQDLITRTLTVVRAALEPAEYATAHLGGTRVTTSEGYALLD